MLPYSQQVYTTENGQGPSHYSSYLIEPNLPGVSEHQPCQGTNTCYQYLFHTPRHAPDAEPWSAYKALFSPNHRQSPCENHQVLNPIQEEGIATYMDQGVNHFRGGDVQGGDPQGDSDNYVRLQRSYLAFLPNPADDAIDKPPSGDPVGPPEAFDQDMAHEPVAVNVPSLKNRGGRDGGLKKQARDHAKKTRNNKSCCWYCKLLRSTVWHPPFPVESRRS